MENNNFKKALNDVVNAECRELSAFEEEHVFSDEFESNMRRLTARRKKPYFHMINTVQKRVACAAAIMLVGASAAVVNVDAVQTAVAKFFIDTYPEYSEFSVAEDETAPETIEDIYMITSGLDGFRVDYISFHKHYRSITYLNDSNTIDFIQRTKNEYHPSVNTEDATIEMIYVGEYEAIYIGRKYMDGKYYHFLIWNSEDYVFSIFTNLSKNELIEMAESVQKVE